MKSISTLYLIILSYTFCFSQALNKVPKYEIQTQVFPEHLTSRSTMDVESIDIDNDGDYDLILAFEFFPNRVFINDNGIFKEKHTLPQLKEYNGPAKGEDSEDIAFADFDRDGDIDLFFVSEDTQNHELLINNGDGSFSLHKNQIPKTGNANAVLIYDFNNDNYPDILIGIKGRNEVYMNIKGDHFKNETEKFWVNNTDDTQDLILADIDGDGDKDIIEAIERGGNNLYINKKGKFIEESLKRLPNMSQIETRKVISGDIDNDGDIDLFFCNVGWKEGVDPQNKLFINNGKGYFTDMTDNAFPNDSATTLDAIFIDINNDMLLDIITTGMADENNKGFHVYINKTSLNNVKFELDSTIFPELKFNIGISIISKDFNNNGKNGIYIGNFREKDLFLLKK